MQFTTYFFTKQRQTAHNHCSFCHCSMMLLSALRWQRHRGSQLLLSMLRRQQLECMTSPPAHVKSWVHTFQLWGTCCEHYCDELYTRLNCFFHTWFRGFNITETLLPRKLHISTTPIWVVKVILQTAPQQIHQHNTYK